MNWGTNSHDRTHHHWQGQKPSPAEHLFSHLFLSRRRAAATTAAGDPWEEQKLGQFRRNTKSTFQSCDNFIEKHTKTVVIILTRKIYVSDFFTIIICTKKNNSEFSPLLSYGCRCLISMFIFWRNDKKKNSERFQLSFSYKVDGVLSKYYESNVFIKIIYGLLPTAMGE